MASPGICDGSLVSPHRVLLLPGSVLPGELAYGALVDALGSDADALVKELEVYATPTPPPDYSLDLEVAGVLREADGRQWARFHLVGYSGGGAAALVFAARHPDRLSSLALLEPAWAGTWDLEPGEEQLWHEYRRLEALPTDQFMRAFMRLGVGPGVELPAPPAGDPPPWLAKRPAGIRAFLHAFETCDLDREALARFDRPVYYALGALSNPDHYGAIAARLGRVFGDFELEVFDERHHFDPPHRIEPERVARSLKAVWSRAEQSGAEQATGPISPPVRAPDTSPTPGG
jgi:pimeloyl-ACP methyl ester carboxylesterase